MPSHLYYIAHREEILAEQRRRWREDAEFREKVRAQRRECWHRNRLRWKYGLSLDEYGEMLKIQDGRCALCRKPLRSIRRPAVDHNHRTQEVRGLLCSRCNGALGQLDLDAPESLQRLVEYLTFGVIGGCMKIPKPAAPYPTIPQHVNYGNTAGKSRTPGHGTPTGQGDGGAAGVSINPKERGNESVGNAEEGE